MRCTTAVALVVAMGAAAQAAQTGAAEPTLDEVLAHTAAYVARFEEGLSNLVAEEQYEQHYALIVIAGPGRLSPTSGGLRRVLKSDFLLVRSDERDEWAPFRDVFEVDGDPVREREDRLMNLFVGASGSAFEQAQRISDESSRYNIGPVTRTVNVPTLPLKFIDAVNQSRSLFVKEGNARVDDVPVWEVTFSEISVPTLIRTTNQRSLPAEGTFWIEPASGAVLRAQLRFRLEMLRSEITVDYEEFEDLGFRVPGELRERYRSPDFVLEGTASYGRLRRFQVITDEVIDEEAIGGRR
jgi:hypothetical protein